MPGQRVRSFHLEKLNPPKKRKVDPFGRELAAVDGGSSEKGDKMEIQTGNLIYT